MTKRMLKIRYLDTLLNKIFMEKLLPKKEVTKKFDIAKEIEKILRTSHDVSIHVIGSCAYNLGLKDGDLDLVCTTKGENSSSEDSQPNLLVLMAKVLEDHSYNIKQILNSATTPIIKFTAQTNFINIDMSLNQHFAIKNTKMIEKFVNTYEFLKPMIVLTKSICKKFNFNCSYQCTLSSYAISLMVIFYFQKTGEIPAMENMDKEDHEETSNTKKNSLFLNLKGFFTFYGYEFNYEKDVISVKKGKLLRKQEKVFNVLNEKYCTVFCVEDPFITDFNVTRTVNHRSVEEIIYFFKIILYCLKKGDISMF